jgi:predicted enzyme related to lactoylglutathione lyase
VPGALTWNELATTGVDAAIGFYSELFGWQAMTLDTGDRPAYTVIRLGERSNGGIRELTPDERRADASPGWSPYFAVASIEEAMTKAGNFGAMILLGPTPLPNGGRIAAVRDPQGAVFAIWDGPLDD